MGLVRYCSAFTNYLTSCSRKAHSSTRRSKSLRQRFHEDRSGAVAIIFALSLFLVVTIAGGAVDYGRLSSAKVQQQAAMDAAVLAAGRVMQVTGDVDAAIDSARQHFDRMKSLITVRETTNFEVVENGSVVRATSDSAVATPFWSIAGISELPINIAAEAKLSVGNNAQTHVEVSLMLDVTGSMSGSKIDDLKLAAKDLIDIVVWEDQGSYTSRVAIAPFSRRVNVGSLAPAMTGLAATSGGNTLIACVTDRSGSEAFTDAAPGSGAWMNAYRGNRTSSSNYSSSGTCNSPVESMMALTSDKNALKTRIDSFGASGTTAGALGTAFTWYMLSPQWNTIWPAGAQARPYSELTQLGPTGKPLLNKIAVLMTDGEYNTERGSYYSDSSDRQRIADNAVQICTNMKAAGITVYTVGFQIGTSGRAYDVMRNCANDPSYFYNSTTGDELRQAFRDIALKIATLRISK